MKCPRCRKEIPTEANFCAACGFSFDDATQRLEKSPSEKSAEKRSDSQSFGSIDDARFVPGTILVDRYRIVGLLGRGGMGEVYRADDLKLGQPVALKFLPDHLLSDGAALARFHREVRVARQVSHKNVCRVYDIGEVDGRHFLSMEFIKGEELSSLLRRIGRLPQDKAIQLARQICAGLAAAHDVGFLHRDLKPANIMIDGEGNARILDFGLGGLAGEFGEEEVRSGTPAYMSPEQIEGKEQTVQSDIYSLGLVLYELFTGRRAFEASSLHELIKLRRSDTTPTTPSEIVKELDPTIERVIDRCLQKNPAQRPSSALQVAAALPGGDPIAAALAAGETPSPEMVAAAPKEGALRPAVAVSLFAAILAGLALVIFFSEKKTLYGYLPLEKSPEVLRENAREVLRIAGVTAPATDYMHDFESDRDAVAYILRTDSRPGRWQDLKDGQPAALYYWYRQSPGYLAGFDHFRDSRTNPPAVVSGMAGVRLDTRGRLLEFYSVPPQIDPLSSSASPAPNAPDWSRLFSAAGLDITQFKQVDSQWSPLYIHDTRAAWEGVYPEQPTIPIRIEAAGYRGKPVHFEIVNPWTRPERQQPSGLTRPMQALFILLLSVFILVVIGSLLLAIRNLRLGRGDLKGALRLAIFVFTLTAVGRLSSAHHIPTLAEFGTVLNSLQDAIFAAAFFWVVYIALEPFVRRRWPHRIISWARLLAGDFRDPMVGRDLLIGGVFGMAGLVWQFSFFFAHARWNAAASKPNYEPSVVNLGIGNFIAGLEGQLSSPLLFGYQFVFLILLLALFLRRDLLAFILGGAIFTTGLAFLGGGALYNWIMAGVTSALVTFVLFRYGVLAMLAMIFYLHIYVQFPATANLTAWYAVGFLLDLVLVLALSIHAFRISLAGQPLSGRKFLDE